MYYIFHGENEFLRRQELDNLKTKLGDSQFADLNTTVLEGRRLTFGELRHHADSIPFLSDKRLVIVEDMLARLDPRQKKSDEDSDEVLEEESNPELKSHLLEYLPVLPDTTRLVFVDNKKLAKNNPILQAAEKDKKHAHIRFFAAPSGGDLPEWITDRTEQKGGTIEFSAANDLALYVGSDLRALGTEIEKLIVYRNGETIRREDIRTMVAPTQDQSIFDLVDALGERKANKALELLHERLQHDGQPLYLYAMITRQYRMLLQVKDLTTRGLTLDQIQKQLGLHPFVTRKVLDQSRNYSLPQLEDILRKLLDIDVGLKTSRMEGSLSLDLFVIELTQ